MTIIAHSSPTTLAYNNQQANEVTTQKMLPVLEQGIKHGVIGIYEDGNIRQHIDSYLHIIDSIYSIIKEHANNPIEQCEVVLNNGDTLNLQNSDTGMTVSCGEIHVVITTVTLKSLNDVFINDALESPAFYCETRIGEYASSLENPEHNNASALPCALQKLVLSHDVTSAILNKPDILAKHRQVDALYERFKVAQPCYLGATYLLQKMNNPDEYTLPPLLDGIAHQGKQIDFGVFFNNGVTEDITLGGIRVSLFYSTFNKASLYLYARAGDIVAHLDSIREYLIKSYPDGCILKTGGGSGHYTYYDTKHDIIYSGNTKAFEDGLSGMPLKDYLQNYFKNIDTKTKETLTVTHHTPQELADTLQAMIDETGVSVEELQRWN
ncbi:hypothetical protein SJI19_18690 [Acerihabitans sp. TG2]|uniref:hypothetical protein n=1 Tax=Acerihabitans sp. TG2 TaxID=3096008 RepID=UPI002B22897C|nr:hypothetical protein [Acerihabitans sp. TG2]MEA9392543.1 hypothetical protein [Acerihabitans sp. TG2]